ncbi:MAG: hypothetical protein GKS01_04210 [Alphaproteobacteria bacterium]|nr:hypothetical protein [Alphaproteobacteria bacterium]
MRKTRKERLTQGASIVEENLCPTPQTERKLRQDTIVSLLAVGDISSDHVRAAEEIRTVFETVSRGMFPASSWRSETNQGSNKRQRMDFIDRMSDREAVLWQRCYLPWTRQLSCEVASGIPGTRWLQMVIDVVVENESLEVIEQKYRLGGGMALGFLVSGLDKYMAIRCEIPVQVRV